MTTTLEQLANKPMTAQKDTQCDFCRRPIPEFSKFYYHDRHKFCPVCQEKHYGKR